MDSLVCPCCCCCYPRAAVMSALGGVVQLKSIAIEERPMGRLHWSALSSQRECVWQLIRFANRKWRSGLNRISHPDWVKLSVELNLRAKPKYEIFPFSTLLLFSGYCHSAIPCVVSIVSVGCNQSYSALFYVVFESLYRCVHAIFNVGKSSSSLSSWHI